MSKRGGRPRQKVKHKGGARVFSSEDQLREEEDQRMREAEWMQRRGNPTPTLESVNEDDDVTIQPTNNEGASFMPGVDDDDEYTSSDEEEKYKGISHLIEVENPNRTKAKQEIRIDEMGEVKMTRKQREQMQAEKDRARQLKQMQEGTSAQAKRDIARLDQIRKEREEAARRREMERKAKELKAQQKLASLK
ncbi:hypothetical protein LOD99_3003 [Oopsacas minuta]|uniref:Casein kinase substrate phosphoprotein PP28 domain-containing protein n=1 Tax=Oopsacas minuta TaxID=111878 RepID=A0AAV7JZQ2_9METZ|nr:hypothetical protein LOD99_3003 [Oopsacas minuta]